MSSNSISDNFAGTITGTGAVGSSLLLLTSCYGCLMFVMFDQNYTPGKEGGEGERKSKRNTQNDVLDNGDDEREEGLTWEQRRWEAAELVEEDNGR